MLIVKQKLAGTELSGLIKIFDEKGRNWPNRVILLLLVLNL